MQVVPVRVASLHLDPVDAPHLVGETFLSANSASFHWDCWLHQAGSPPGHRRLAPNRSHWVPLLAYPAVRPAGELIAIKALTNVVRCVQTRSLPLQVKLIHRNPVGQAFLSAGSWGGCLGTVPIFGQQKWDCPLRVGSQHEPAHRFRCANSLPGRRLAPNRSQACAPVSSFFVCGA